MKILVINGPNLNLLGYRQPEIYGTKTLLELEREIKAHAKKERVAVECYQSNAEHEIIELIHGSLKLGFDGILINGAAYSHTSIAILDALQGIGLPYVNVHLSEPEQREAFRHSDILASKAISTIKGFGFKSYLIAISRLKQHLTLQDHKRK